MKNRIRSTTRGALGDGTLPLRMDIQISSTPSEAELVGRLRRGHSHLQGLGNRWAGEGRKRDRGD